jgi:hypothetical protein
LAFPTDLINRSRSITQSACTSDPSPHPHEMQI